MVRHVAAAAVYDKQLCCLLLSAVEFVCILSHAGISLLIPSHLNKDYLLTLVMSFQFQ